MVIAMSRTDGAETARAGFGVGGGDASVLVVMVGLGMLATGVGNAFAFGFVEGLKVSGAELTALVAVVASLISLQGIGFLGTSLAYLRLSGRSDLLRASMPSVRGHGLIVGGFVLAFALNLVRTVVTVALDLQPSSVLVEAGGSDTTLLLFMIVATVVFVAPVEELLFRGIIQGRLSESYGPWLGVPVASLLFAAIHLPGLSGSLPARLLTVAGLFALALVLGALYERTDNLVVPWAVHSLYNASLFGLVYVVLLAS